MKKIVVTYGLIAAGISAVMWTFICIGMKNDQEYSGSMLVGYTAMTLSLLMIYFAQASYRSNIGKGYISFGKAIQIGLLITLIAGICHVIVWAIIYNTMLPDYLDKYMVSELNTLRESGASAEKLQNKADEMVLWKERYKNPIWFFLITFMEMLPVGIIVTLVSSFLVRMKNKPKSLAIN